MAESRDEAPDREDCPDSRNRLGPVKGLILPQTGVQPDEMEGSSATARREPPGVRLRRKARGPRDLPVRQAGGKAQGLGSRVERTLLGNAVLSRVVDPAARTRGNIPSAELTDMIPTDLADTHQAYGHGAEGYP